VDAYTTRQEVPDMKRLVLMLDGSPAATSAARWCSEHAGPDVEVVAVTTISPFGAFMLGLPPSRTSDWLPEIRAALEERWVAPLRDARVPYRALVVNRPPVTALIETAQREHADAIVVGKPNHGFLSEHVLGSLATDLVHHAQIPIIVVPEG